MNKLLVPDQKGAVILKEFGGLLDLAASSMPGDLSQWIMKHYDPEMSQIVIPERGKIPVDAASVRRIWGLPNKGRKVCFENRPEFTKEMNNIYGLTGKNSPTLTAWCKMITEMAGAYDDKFLRVWLVVAFSCFLAPSTSLTITPKCFPAVIDVNGITDTNFYQFVVDQLKIAFTLAGGKKNAVCCCVFHLVLLYLDSLDVDEPIPSVTPRVSVWNSDLIGKVVKKDKIGPGQYGKLRLKTEFARCTDDSLFGSMDHVSKFVAARLPESYDTEKHKKLTAMVHEMCTEISHAVGKLVHGIGRIDDDKPGPSRTKKQATKHGKKRQQNIDSESDEDSYSTEEEGSESEESYKSDSNPNSDSDGDDDDDHHNGGFESTNDGHSTNEGGDHGERENKEGEGDEGAKGDEEESKKANEDRKDQGNNAEGEEKVVDEETEDEDKEDQSEDDEEEEDEDGGKEDGDKDDDGDGDGKDDEDKSGDDKSGSGSDGDHNGNEEAAAGISDSDDDDNCTLQLLIQKNQGSKAKGLDEEASISMRDVVMMEREVESRMPHIPKFEVKEMWDEPPVAWQANKFFKEIVNGLVEKTVPTDLPGMCPKLTRKRLMKQIYGCQDTDTEIAVAKKSLPPLPPKRKKKVSFIREPTSATKTVQQLAETHAKSNQMGQSKKPISSLKKVEQPQMQHQAFLSEAGASHGQDKPCKMKPTTSKTKAVYGEDTDQCVHTTDSIVSNQAGKVQKPWDANGAECEATQSSREAILISRQATMSGTEASQTNGKDYNPKPTTSKATADCVKDEAQGVDITATKCRAMQSIRDEPTFEEHDAIQTNQEPLRTDT